MSGALLVAGTASNAGKSLLTAGICRWLRRRGVRVAPFKAQNMSTNSAVAIGPDGQCGEIGRAQALQAVACDLEPDVRFNPVLLKPRDDVTSQVVLLGAPVAPATAAHYQELRPRLAGVILDTLADLRAEYDVVICEGAGSPAEINLRAGDVVNMGLARAAGLPVVVVGDIDRGGVFAALFGTLALLSPEDQALVAGFVINKFRGDVGLLRPGLDMLAAVTGRPTYGVLPWRSDLWADAEDSLAHGELLGRPAPPHGAEWLRVVAIRWPRIATVTDLEALAVEPGVQVRLTAAPADIAAADLVILPASTATVADLAWLRATGLADAVWRHAAAGKPLLGLASGYQMLGRAIRSASRPSDTIPGLGLLDIDVTLAARATVTRAAGTAYDGIPVSGYAIHHGHVTRGGPVPPLLRDADGRPEGAAAGHIVGTHWHGLFECDAFRRRFLVEVAQRAGRHGFRPAPDTRFAAVRQRVLDLLGDLVEEHLDTAALWRLIEDGPPPGLPFVPPGAPRDMTAPGP